MVTKDKDRLWFCSDYGIENKAIINKLTRADEKIYIVAHDNGNQWRNLPPLLKRKVMRESMYGKAIYGIGLEGTIPGANITNLDVELQENGDKISILEQVNEIIGMKMSLDEQFIASYAKNGMDGVNKTATRLKITKTDAQKITENILIRNHQAIGIPLDQEAKLARQINTSKQKSKSDHDTIVAIDNWLNRDNELLRY